jgi:hypothetical protein
MAPTEEPMETWGAAEPAVGADAGAAEDPGTEDNGTE